MASRHNHTFSWADTDSVPSSQDTLFDELTRQPAVDDNLSGSKQPRMRWGLPARRSSQAPPEPQEWQPALTVWQRVTRAAAVPAAAAAAVFVAVVLISIATVWFRPHEYLDPAEIDAESAVSTQSSGFSDESLGLADGSDFLRGTEVEQLFVHVVGKVTSPGVYELAVGSRVADAIDAAGGAEATAELAGVNLARVLSDGEQIVVPDASDLASASGGAPPASGAGTGQNGVINLNLADAAALESLPRVGPALAQRILDWRGANGGFDSVDQLLNVSGIGQKTFEQLADRVTV